MELPCEVGKSDRVNEERAFKLIPEKKPSKWAKFLSIDPKVI